LFFSSRSVRMDQERSRLLLMKVVELRKMCRQKGLDSKGKKIDLVERLYDNFCENAPTAVDRVDDRPLEPDSLVSGLPSLDVNELEVGEAGMIDVPGDVRARAPFFTKSEDCPEIDSENGAAKRKRADAPDTQQLGSSKIGAPASAIPPVKRSKPLRAGQTIIESAIGGIKSMSVSQLKTFIQTRGFNLDGCIEKEDLIQRAVQALRATFSDIDDDVPSIRKVSTDATTDDGVSRIREVAPDATTDDDVPRIKEVAPDAATRSFNCPYLDTINRTVLDFDFEKLCSVNLSNLNVYACLVCGKYFQGRGSTTHAYTHSLECDHHVFLNLSTLKFYCLPDNYEIIDSSLEDITYYLRPTFSPDQIALLDSGTVRSRALDGRSYLPGLVGLNNIKANDYVNVTLQLLCRVHPLRNFFLVEANTAGIDDPLITTFGELVRKICSSRNFKSHVSPHEFLQAVSNASDKRFLIIQQSDPYDFVMWFINTLHQRLRKRPKKGLPKTSIVEECFQGSLSISSRILPPTDAQLKAGETYDPDDPKYQETTSTKTFMILPLDVPPPPLFSADEAKIIPQIPLYELFNKFDGVTEKEYKSGDDLVAKKFQLTQLPPYLIVHIKRFTKNTFFVEKNPTVVNFPVRNLILRDYLAMADDDLRLMKYDLVANAVHEGLPGPGKGIYKSQVLHSGVGEWFEVQDLHVDDILPQMIPLSTSYIQIWQMRETTPEEMAAVAAARETEGGATSGGV